jgi:hypothetical protein
MAGIIAYRPDRPLCLVQGSRGSLARDGGRIKNSDRNIYANLGEVAGFLRTLLQLSSTIKVRGQ